MCPSSVMAPSPLVEPGCGAPPPPFLAPSLLPSWSCVHPQDLHHAVTPSVPSFPSQLLLGREDPFPGSCQVPVPQPVASPPQGGPSPPCVSVRSCLRFLHPPRHVLQGHCREHGSGLPWSSSCEGAPHPPTHRKEGCQPESECVCSPVTLLTAATAT